LNKTFSDLSKLEPLDGNNFKRWSQKLLIFFEQLEVDYVLFNEPSMNGSNTTIDSSNVMVVDDVSKMKFEKDNRTMTGHLLNHMTNPLFDLFVTYKSTKEIWNSLEKKYDVIKQLLKHNVIYLKYVRFDSNLVHPLIKGLTWKMILKTSRGMGLKPIN